MRSSTSLLLLSAASIASAQSIVPELSFGHQVPLSKDGQTIPEWDILTQNHRLQILSDRLTLTPPVPGNTRGALWTESVISVDDWSFEFEFRAAGQDHGSGNLQLWYTKESKDVGTDSVYTVDRFDGLAIVIDQYGGTGGKIRGFLSDASKSYRNQANLESLAFGHCDYQYRNLGRPSKLKVSHGKGLKVEIDGRECFSSSKISLPNGYHFGITAATSENPDSFEVNKFVVSDLSASSSRGGGGSNSRESGGAGSEPRANLKRGHSSNLHFGTLPEQDKQNINDREARDIKGDQAQFDDLHTRLQDLQHRVIIVGSELVQMEERAGKRHIEMLDSLPDIAPSDFERISRRLESIEHTLDRVNREVSDRDFRKTMDEVKKSLNSPQKSAATTSSVGGTFNEQQLKEIAKAIQHATPGPLTLILYFIVVQVVLFAGVTVYTNRRSSHQKYL